MHACGGWLKKKVHVEQRCLCNQAVKHGTLESLQIDAMPAICPL